MNSKRNNNAKKVEDLKKKTDYTFNDLVDIMEILRSENGCPWDREQHHKTIRNNLIEECYEAVEAIDTENSELLREELGDVLLQVVFHAKISEDDGGFNIDGVADRICKKLILRHPHVFGDVAVSDSGEVLKNWDAIKKKEKSLESGSSVMKSVSPALPALMRASKVQKKAANEHFDFNNTAETIEKLTEELSELKEAIESGNKDNIEEEFGDLLFSAVNLSRFIKVNAEEALTHSTNKFVTRFERCEHLALNDGKIFSQLSFDEQNEYWDKAKKQL
ncbi:MAG: nucleoside triphosphate pyrophosphohydrolase [Clostridia bacterium]|nr:nucleoside triphosphate pyrophosphohydrolase [Clostridia bacterium]